MAFAHLIDRRQRQGLPGSMAIASCSGRLVPRSANCPWSKPSMAFAHLIDRRQRQGLPGSMAIASCSGRLPARSIRSLTFC